MKRTILLSFLLVLTLASIGCSEDNKTTDNSQANPSHEKQAEATEQTLSEGAEKEVSFNGLTVKVGPSWEVDKNDNFGWLRVNASDGFYFIAQSYLRGETESIESFISSKTYLGSDYQVESENDTNGMHVSVVSSLGENDAIATYAIGYDASTGSGYSILFSIAKEWINDTNLEIRDDIISSAVFEPNNVEFDSLERVDEYSAKWDEEHSTQEPLNDSNEAGSQPTASQSNALRMAHQYIDSLPFSYSGLIEQLEFEGFSTEDATYAADNCGADWNRQAELMAERYLDTMAFSHSGLVDQLVFEGFTQEQAEHGASSVGL